MWGDPLCTRKQRPTGKDYDFSLPTSVAFTTQEGRCAFDYPQTLANAGDSHVNEVILLQVRDFVSSDLMRNENGLEMFQTKRFKPVARTVSFVSIVFMGQIRTMQGHWPRECVREWQPFVPTYGREKSQYEYVSC